MNSKMTLQINEKIAQYKKENRKIVPDERGLYFYEGMTAGEKIEWIEYEITNIKEHIQWLKKAEKELFNKSYTDYHEEFYAERYVFAKPNTRIKNIEKQCAQYVMDRIAAEATYIKECQKEYEAEIKAYQEDIQFYQAVIAKNYAKQLHLFF